MVTEVIPAAKNSKFWRLGSSTGLASLCETRLDTPAKASRPRSKRSRTRKTIADAIGDLPYEHPEDRRVTYAGGKYEHCDICDEVMTPLTEGWTK